MKLGGFRAVGRVGVGGRWQDGERDGYAIGRGGGRWKGENGKLGNRDGGEKTQIHGKEDVVRKLGDESEMEGLCDREREIRTEGGEEGWLTTGRGMWSCRWRFVEGDERQMNGR